MQRCAPEIWGEIFRQIDGSRKQKNESLKAMCLAFKAVAPYAQAELFTDVTISSAAAAERLLQLSLLKPTLLQRTNTLRLDLSPRSSLWEWLLRPPALNLLPHFASTTCLELAQRFTGEPAPMDSLNKVFHHFNCVKHLHLVLCYEYRDFHNIATLLCCFQSTLERLDYAVMALGEDFEEPISEDVPAVLSADTLSNYVHSGIFPHLTYLAIEDWISPQFVEWVIRSSAANQVRTLALRPVYESDLKLVAVILKHGCERLERLELCMVDDGCDPCLEDFFTSLWILPSRLTSLRCLRAVIGYEALIVPLLGTLPGDNALNKIEITTNGDSFDNIAATLDELLSEPRFSKLRQIVVELDVLNDGKQVVDYAAAMPRMLERGILQVFRASEQT